MYRRILAAVNEHTNAEVAAHYALALAKSSGAKLSFVFVAQAEQHRDSLRRAEAALERLFIEAEQQGIAVESISETGDPLEGLSGFVKREKVDLTFVATRHEDVTKRYFQKTLARTLMLKLPCAVAMVRVVRMARVHPKHILVPVRGQMTRLDERGCFVAEIARSFGATVTVFHAPKAMETFFHGKVHVAVEERDRHMPRDVEQFTDCLNRHLVRHHRKVVYGSAGRAITIEAAHRTSDLIIMGASERSLLRSLVSGNPVEDVLRETPCNLIVFRPGRWSS